MLNDGGAAMLLDIHGRDVLGDQGLKRLSTQLERTTRYGEKWIHPEVSHLTLKILNIPFLTGSVWIYELIIQLLLLFWRIRLSIGIWNLINKGFFYYWFLVFSSQWRWDLFWWNTFSCICTWAGCQLISQRAMWLVEYSDVISWLPFRLLKWNCSG